MKEKKSASDIDTLIDSSQKLSSINAEILQKLEQNEDVVRKLSFEVSRLRDSERKKSEINEIETQEKQETIQSLNNELNELKKRLLLTEAAFKRKQDETNRLIEENNQLKKSDNRIKKLSLYASAMKEDERKKLNITELQKELQKKEETAQFLNNELNKNKKSLLLTEAVLRKKEKEFETLAEENNDVMRKNLALEKIERKENEIKGSNITKLQREMQKKEGMIQYLQSELNESKKNILLSETVFRKKENELRALAQENTYLKIRPEYKSKYGKIIKTEEDEIKFLEKKAREINEEKNNVALALLEEKRKNGELHDKIMIKEKQLQEANISISKLRTFCMDELKNRKVIEKNEKTIRDLHKHIEEINKILNLKETALRTLKEEFDIERKSRKDKEFEETIKLLITENNELKAAMSKEKSDVHRIKEYYLRLFNIHKYENDERFNSLVRQAAEREVELNALIQNLNQNLDEKDKKIEQQKNFYIELQRKIRNNIFETGLLLEEEKKKEEKRKDILSFILNKNTITKQDHHKEMEKIKTEREHERRELEQRHKQEKELHNKKHAEYPIVRVNVKKMEIETNENLTPGIEIRENQMTIGDKKRIHEKAKHFVKDITQQNNREQNRNMTPAIAGNIEKTPAPVPLGVKLAGTPEKIDRSQEIIQLINVAKQHGDNEDKIKESLISSGYDKDDVDKAFFRIYNALRTQ
ncbi:MAG: hypothetical protein Q8O89_03660 [Nanoarchaeota archaeon]|nr:hypothetical protein [Nanoarchaeota archaeon]